MLLGKWLKQNLKVPVNWYHIEAIRKGENKRKEMFSFLNIIQTSKPFKK
jgi:hypothetical protein